MSNVLPQFAVLVLIAGQLALSAEGDEGSPDYRDREICSFTENWLALSFSRAGPHVAFVESKDHEPNTLIVDGQRIATGKHITKPVFSPDGSRYLYGMTTDKEWKLFVSGHPQPLSDSISVLASASCEMKAAPYKTDEIIYPVRVWGGMGSGFHYTLYDAKYAKGKTASCL